MVLSGAEREAFFQEGYITVKNLLNAAELAQLRQRYDALATGQVADYPERHVSVRDVPGRTSFGQAQPPREPEPATSHGPHHNRRGTQVFPAGEERYAAARTLPVAHMTDAVLKMNVPSRYDDTFRAWAHHPKVVDIIEELMGPHIKLYYDQVFAKPPYDKANRYHQDSVFWSFFASNFQITCQILLDDATEENGCIRFLPGSQRFGLVNWEHLPYLLTPDLLEQEVAVPLKAGDATFHHSLALHCSGPNTTAGPRRGWSIHYVAADTRYIGTPEESEQVKTIDCLVGPEPVNGWPLIRGREFPGCV